MKFAKMSFVWFMVSLALGALLVVKWSNESRQKLKVEQLQLQVEEASKAARLAQSKVGEHEQEALKARSELRATEMEAFRAKQQAAVTNQAMAAALKNAQNRSPSGAPAAPAEKSNPIAAMLKDPEMRKMIQAQQTAMMGMMYGPLFKKLGLTTEESDKLKAILNDSQSKATDLAGTLMDQDGDAKKAALKEMTDGQQESQKQIKELLGEEKFAKYQEYSSTMGERMMMTQFQTQHNLPSEKMDQLLDLIRQEKQAAQVPDMNNAAGTQEFMNMMNKPDAFKKMIDQQKLVNERVVQRASGVLSPEELKDFAEFQESQGKMQQLGLEAAAKMFGPAKTEQPAPPTVVPQAQP